MFYLIFMLSLIFIFLIVIYFILDHVSVETLFLIPSLDIMFIEILLIEILAS
jgi:hypothetical protein